MTNKQLLDELRVSIIEGDEEQALKLTKKALAEEINALEIIDNALSVGIREAGALYEEGEYFLPDIVCAADAMKKALEMLQPYLDSETSISKGKIVIATVQGDIHDIGKTIVASMLTSAGFTVYDLGCDVPNEEVIRVAKEKNADLVGLSALLATTMQEQRVLVEAFKNSGIPVKVIIGGAPVTQEFADMIGASGYAENALDAVRLANKLMEK